MPIKRSVNDGFNAAQKDFSRRDILILGAGAVAVSSTAFSATAQAADEATHHGLSAFGDLGYPADFKHLKYVNPSAPKGGNFSQLAGGGTATFNSFNGFILKGDPAYREYMLWMGIFGGGNLMLTAQLVLLFSEQLHLTSALQIGLLAVVPLITQPLFMPWWARLFDGSHVVRYRSRQGWALVLACCTLCLGVFTRSLVLLWAGAVLLGAANAGANLGWNLGHNDFASIGRAQHYMGVHVTLTGLRGGIAPPLGVLAYMGLEYWHHGAGRYALVLPVALTTAGALGFSRMGRALAG